MSTKKIKYSTFEEATGPIEFTFTNDYMFRAIMQENEKVLRGLISSLLHLNPDEILTVTIENPIKLGETIEQKDFILDIHITLNNNTRINLEMQVTPSTNWPDRSLSYLCRCFDHLEKGNEYELAYPAIHIGILDFTLFPDDIEFYSHNKLMNVKSHKIYNDKFMLNVLSLNQIELATEEDKFWKIDLWAKLFKTKTWEDIKMLAKNNDILTSAAESIFKMNADDLILEQCRAREEYERHERTVQKTIKDQAEIILSLKQENTQLNTKIQELFSENQKLFSQNQELSEQLKQLTATVLDLQKK